MKRSAGLLLLLLVLLTTATALAQVPQKERRFVYGLNLFDGVQFVTGFVPPATDTVFVLADHLGPGPAEGALGEMERGITMLARARKLVSGNGEHTLRQDNADRFGRHAGQISEDLDAGLRFEHVHRRYAFARAGSQRRLVLEPLEHPAEVVAGVAMFENNPGHDARHFSSGSRGHGCPGEPRLQLPGQGGSRRNRGRWTGAPKAVKY